MEQVGSKWSYVCACVCLCLCVRLIVVFPATGLLFTVSTLCSCGRSLFPLFLAYCPRFNTYSALFCNIIHILCVGDSLCVCVFIFFIGENTWIGNFSAVYLFRICVKCMIQKESNKTLLKVFSSCCNFRDSWHRDNMALIPLLSPLSLDVTYFISLPLSASSSS